MPRELQGTLAAFTLPAAEEAAAGGECAINPRFMHRQCRRSCSRAEFGRTCDTREQSAWPDAARRDLSAGVARPRDADFGNATIDLPEHA